MERLGHVWIHAWLHFGDCKAEPGVCVFELSEEPARRLMLASKSQTCSQAVELTSPVSWSALAGAQCAEVVLESLCEVGALQVEADEPPRRFTCTQLYEMVSSSPLFEPLTRADTDGWGIEYL